MTVYAAVSNLSPKVLFRQTCMAHGKLFRMDTMAWATRSQRRPVRDRGQVASIGQGSVAEQDLPKRPKLVAKTSLASG